MEQPVTKSKNNNNVKTINTDEKKSEFLTPTESDWKLFGLNYNDDSWLNNILSDIPTFDWVLL